MTFVQWLRDNPKEEPESFSDLLTVWKKFTIVKMAWQKKQEEVQAARKKMDWYFNCLEQR